MPELPDPFNGEYDNEPTFTTDPDDHVGQAIDEFEQYRDHIDGPLGYVDEALRSGQLDESWQAKYDAAYAGLAPYFSLIDELHEWQNKNLPVTSTIDVGVLPEAELRRLGLVPSEHITATAPATEEA